MTHDEYKSGGSSADLPAIQVAEVPNRATRNPRNAFTILKTTNGKLASKRFVADEQGRVTKIDYDAGKHFTVIEAPASNIAELSSMLNLVEPRRDCLVIRGAPRTDLDASQTQQRLKTNFQSPPAGRSWVLIDADKIKLPPGMSLQQDISAVCEYFIGLLPLEFHNSSYHWQLSSSAGMGDPSIVSLHLWFWLDRPIPDALLKRWALHWNAQAGSKLIDPALINDVQAHYTAAPMFEGLSDPFPVRSGLVRKAIDEVALRLPDLKKAPPTRVRVSSLQPGKGFETILGQIGDHEGGLGFHLPILRAVASYVGTHGQDGTDIEALYDVVRAKVLAADRSSHDSDDYIEQMASREHIVRAIEQGIVKYGNPSNPRRKSRQIPGVPPHFASKQVAAADGAAMLRRAVEGFFGQKR